MTITITHQSYEETWAETSLIKQLDPADSLDIIRSYPSKFGQGCVREIELSAGLYLEIFDCQLFERLLIKRAEQEGTFLCFHFHLSGYHIDFDTEVKDREYAIYGIGLSPLEICDGPPQNALEVSISLELERFKSYLGDRWGQLPLLLSQWVRPSCQQRYTRVGKVTPLLEGILWQIVRCPLRGVTKRMYLEGKVLELVSLAIAEELEIHQEKKRQLSIKHETLDRIYEAEQLLLKNLDRPPSLSELAQQVQLNEFTLKQGFKTVFNCTIFDYLRDRRLEQAKQLLETGQMTVAEVMKVVGYCDRHHFAAAFRRKFEVNPRDYRKKYKF